MAEYYEQEPFTAFTSESETATHSLLRCENQLVKILGAYVSNSRASIFVRLQNVSAEILGTRILIDFDFQSAHLCRFDEEVAEEVFLFREYLNVRDIDGVEADREICALDINFAANEVKTIEFRLAAAASEKSSSVSRVRQKRSSSSKTG